MAQLSVSDVSRLKLKWAFGFPGDVRAWAQPTMVGGRIFVGSQGRRVYSLNASSGCVYWVTDSDYPVRSAITIGQQGGRWMAYFGDHHANAYALDAMTGKVLWKTRVNEHPLARITGAPTLFEGRLYVPASSSEEAAGADANYTCCRFRGSVSALDAATGKTSWQAFTIPGEAKPTRKNQKGAQLYGPSGAGVWSSPTVDAAKRALYVTTGDSYSDPPAPTSTPFWPSTSIRERFSGRARRRKATPSILPAVILRSRGTARRPRVRISTSGLLRSWSICQMAAER